MSQRMYLVLRSMGHTHIYAILTLLACTVYFAARHTYIYNTIETGRIICGQPLSQGSANIAAHVT